MNNVYLFSGDEKYLLDLEVERWRNNFVQKFGAGSVFSFSTETFDPARVGELLSAGGLFVEKKLIVLYGAPLDTNGDNKLSTKYLEWLTDRLIASDGKIAESVLLVLVSYVPDKRSKLYKFLSTHVQVKEFRALSPVVLKVFVKEQLKGTVLDDAVIDYFLMKVGKDLYRIMSELDKLRHRNSVYPSRRIDNEVVDLLVYGQVEVNTFLFLDYLLPEPDKALLVLEKMQNSGADEYQTLGMLYRGLTLYIYLLDLYQQDVRDVKTITQMTKYPPFAVSKAWKHIDLMRVKSEKIRLFFRTLVDVDYRLKTGALSLSAFWLELKKAMYML